MPRSREAYLADIIDACDSIDIALSGVDVEAVLRIAQHDVPVLRDEIRSLLADIAASGAE